MSITHRIQTPSNLPTEPPSYLHTNLSFSVADCIITPQYPNIQYKHAQTLNTRTRATSPNPIYPCEIEEKEEEESASFMYIVYVYALGISRSFTWGVRGGAREQGDPLNII